MGNRNDDTELYPKKEAQHSQYELNQQGFNRIRTLGIDKSLINDLYGNFSNNTCIVYRIFFDKAQGVYCFLQCSPSRNSSRV